MQEIKGLSLFDVEEGAIVITTNGVVDPAGNAILKSETGIEAAKKWFVFSSLLGDHIRRNGNCVGLISSHGINNNMLYLVSFPTKPSKIYSNDKENIIKAHLPTTAPLPRVLPGWASYSNLNIIKHSVEELVELTDKRGWTKVYLPKVGCGSGGLSWPTVRKLLKEKLDDRFIVLTIPSK